MKCCAGSWSTAGTCARCSARRAACDRCFPDSKCGVPASDSLNLDIQSVSMTGQPVFGYLVAYAVPYNKALHRTSTLVTYGRDTNATTTQVFRNTELLFQTSGKKATERDKDIFASGVIYPVFRQGIDPTEKKSVTVQVVDGLSITNALTIFDFSGCSSGLRSAILFNVRTAVAKVSVIGATGAQPLANLRFEVAPGSRIAFNVSVTGRSGAPLEGYTPTVVVLRTPPSVCVGRTPCSPVCLAIDAACSP